MMPSTRDAGGDVAGRAAGDRAPLDPCLDRAPLGRNQTGTWWRRHDEYR
jgi:predicted dithiol-disulfide oxidoreductase (DUF899 family)